MEKEMMEVYGFLLETVETTNKLSIPALQCFVCMVLEEGCKTHGYNMLSCVNEILAAAEAVNEVDGTY